MDSLQSNMVTVLRALRMPGWKICRYYQWKCS